MQPWPHLIKMSPPIGEREEGGQGWTGRCEQEVGGSPPMPPPPPSTSRPRLRTQPLPQKRHRVNYPEFAPSPIDSSANLGCFRNPAWGWVGEEIMGSGVMHR